MDAGGLIAVDRNDRRTVVLLARARETGSRVTVPASALSSGRPSTATAGTTRPATSAADHRRRYFSTGLMPPTSDCYLLRAGRRMLWMLTLSSALAAPVNRPSPLIRMIFGLSIQPSVVTICTDRGRTPMAGNSVIDQPMF